MEKADTQVARSKTPLGATGYEVQFFTNSYNHTFSVNKCYIGEYLQGHEIFYC